MSHGARAEGAGNRTVNIEVGVLRRVLKQFKLWQFVSDGYKPLPEPKDIGRALSPEQELRLFSVASARQEWSVAFWVSLIAANTTAGGCELRNLRLRDIDIEAKLLCVRVGKNKFRGSGQFPHDRPADAAGGGCSLNPPGLFLA